MDDRCQRSLPALSCFALLPAAWAGARQRGRGAAGNALIKPADEARCEAKCGGRNRIHAVAG